MLFLTFVSKLEFLEYFGEFQKEQKKGFEFNGVKEKCFLIVFEISVEFQKLVGGWVGVGVCGVACNTPHIINCFHLLQCNTHPNY